MKKITCVFALVALALFATGAASRPRLDPPVINPAGGCYSINATVMVSIRGGEGTELIYTLDGTIPARGRGIHVRSNQVEFQLPSGDVVVRCIAVRAGFEESRTSKAEFVRSARPPG